MSQCGSAVSMFPPCRVLRTENPRTQSSVLSTQSSALAAPIRGTRIARQQQRNVVVAIAVENLEINRHAAEERHIAIQLAEVNRNVEGQLVGADLQRLAQQNRHPAIVRWLRHSHP